MRTAILLLVLAWWGAAAASDVAVRETALRSGLSVDEVKRHLDNCEQSQFTMNLCTRYQFVLADIELTEEYKKLTKRKEERNIEILRQAQRAWVQLRDLNCAYESSDLEGGSLRPSVELSVGDG